MSVGDNSVTLAASKNNSDAVLDRIVLH